MGSLAIKYSFNVWLLFYVKCGIGIVVLGKMFPAKTNYKNPIPT